MIPLGLNLKIIDFLNKSHQPEFIRVYLENARELSVGQQDCHINCLELYAQHFIPIGINYDFLVVFIHLFLQVIMYQLCKFTNKSPNC